MHYGFLHIAFNMFILYQVGIFLEPATGHLRLFLLYLVSVLGGAAGALLLDPFALDRRRVGRRVRPRGRGDAPVVASGRAVRPDRRGARCIVINFALGFFIGGVSIGGHIGGIVAGLLATEALLQGRRAGQRWLGLVGVALVGVAAVSVALWAAHR